MTTAFQIAVIVVAVFIGIVSTLGVTVLIKLITAGLVMRQQIQNIPAQLAQRQQALNDQQAKIVAAQKQLAMDKAAQAQAQAEPETAKATVTNIDRSKS